MTTRDVSLDNAKGALILLVVLGHLIYPVENPNGLARSLYIFIYLFHMPMFILMAGYLSKPSRGVDALLANARQLLAPFALFALIHWVLLQLTGQTDFPLYESHFALWFLVSLFCWRLLLPFLAPLRFALPLSVATSLACGFTPQIGLTFSLSRTLVFLPFFLAGHHLRTKGKSPLELMSPKVAALVVIAMAAASYGFSEVNIQNTLTGAISYAGIGVPLWFGPILRSAHLLAALATGAAFLALMPRQAGFLTRMGRYSLHVYLLHTLLLILYRSNPAYYELLGRSPLLLIPAALVVTWLLSSPVAIRLTGALITPLKK